jgi:hypothetical protein
VEHDPHRRQHSHAESLAQRGLFAEAAADYERAVLTSPDDPEPYLRLARLQREDPYADDRAVQWLHRALPELDFIAKRFATLPAAAWAGEQLDILRQMLQSEQDGGPTLEEQYRARRTRDADR